MWSSRELVALLSQGKMLKIALISLVAPVLASHLDSGSSVADENLISAVKFLLGSGFGYSVF